MTPHIIDGSVWSGSRPVASDRGSCQFTQTESMLIKPTYGTHVIGSHERNYATLTLTHLVVHVITYITPLYLVEFVLNNL